MSFFNSEEAKNTAASSSLWENVTKPIMHQNSNKFLKELTQDQVRIVESVAGKELDELGYQRVYVAKGEEIVYSQKQIEEFTRENDRMKKEQSEKTDPEDARKRKIQEGVLTELKEMVKAW